MSGNTAGSNIVVGIGFLGAGLIFLTGNEVRGLTTAAGVWIVAALGMTVALELYNLAIFTALVTLAVLILFRFIERLIPRE
ncbi:MAG: MgtC/SapB transporter [Candidatus Giovannonibacteria bacterium GW2011_GWA2_53_7]|uniref:MgtC/SapB transporter n=1 Tax=Candidatus Giovannonibacteria bacterium GW2011_GWA2_53_7 TaxID=1618650 RepID=A0A0G1ZZW5_9BACT|nr:MAG: MgtC/SapB transporter [Candidatus Giovannonibacteria bacterium GW2011_GWA2_53_7]